jgi:TPR repeat protein
MYLNGDGVAQNHKEALMWALKAANQGEAIAQLNLARMYANGKGVAQDLKKAVIWIRKAADQGYPALQTQLGYFYSLELELLKITRRRRCGLGKQQT